MYKVQTEPHVLSLYTLCSNSPKSKIKMLLYDVLYDFLYLLEK